MRRSAWLGLVFVALALAGWGRAADSAEEPVYQGKTLTEWIGDLKSPTAGTRSAAAKTLHVFGPAKGSVLALAAALKDERHEVVLAVAQTLGKFGSRAREALPDLRAAFKRLEEKPIESPYGTVYRDGSYGASSSSQSHPVVTKSQARVAVAEALVLIDDRPGPELATVLVEAYRSADASKRRDVVIALGKLGPDAAKVTVPALVNVLGDTDDKIRLEAIKSLGRIGPAAKVAIHPLTLVLKKHCREKATATQYAPANGFNMASAGSTSNDAYVPDLEILRACAEALGKIRPGAKGMVAAMRVALRDLDEDVRLAALCVLKATDTETGGLLPLVLSLHRDKNDAVRQAALEVVGKTNGNAKQIVPLLVAALKDEKAEVRLRAARLLSKRGKSAKQAAPALASALKDREACVRSAAAESLQRIAAKDKETIQALITALNDKDYAVAKTAADALATAGPAAKAAIPRLLAYSKEPDPEKRCSYYLLLARFGPVAKEALSILEKEALPSSPMMVRLVAHYAMVKIDHTRKKHSVAFLAKALTNKDVLLIGLSAKLLEELGADARDAIPALRAMQKSHPDFDQQDIEHIIEAIQNPKKAPRQ